MDIKFLDFLRKLCKITGIYPVLSIKSAGSNFFGNFGGADSLIIGDFGTGKTFLTSAAALYSAMDIIGLPTDFSELPKRFRTVRSFFVNPDGDESRSDMDIRGILGDLNLSGRYVPFIFLDFAPKAFIKNGIKLGGRMADFDFFSDFFGTGIPAAAENSEGVYISVGTVEGDNTVLSVYCGCCGIIPPRSASGGDPRKISEFILFNYNSAVKCTETCGAILARIYEQWSVTGKRGPNLFINDIGIALHYPSLNGGKKGVLDFLKRVREYVIPGEQPRPTSVVNAYYSEDDSGLPDYGSGLNVAEKRAIKILCDNADYVILLERSVDN